MLVITVVEKNKILFFVFVYEHARTVLVSDICAGAR
jgi:hypothetical protein